MNRAQGLGIRGWVRNLGDGAVEVVAQAMARAMADLTALLRAGPPGAHVEELNVADVPHELVDTKSFIIKH